ncbi:initiator tRNA phosphoribosyl transferase [Ceratobasidium sp. AG-I]|nr:initiator tRNA phosphoribosyl transferase [Ceratobasidium sp. AG-I]
MVDLRSSGLNVLRQEMTNTFNRLHSINRDALFVQKVAETGTLPVIPNLRCGAWYVDPALVPPDENASAYFKSTDGHTSQWAFNLRRANLHLLPIIVAHGGIILVDSTRRGKRHPDALSRTVPIWCAVINQTLGFQDEYSCLFTPPDAVSPSEHAQMEARIAGWAEELKASAYTLPSLTKPLRPLWISPDSSNPRVPSVDASSPFYPIICLSASRRVQDGVDRQLGFTYVQGSGDDHEMWSQGLTPSVYWRHKSELLACSQDELQPKIEELLEQDQDIGGGLTCHGIEAVRGRLLVGSWSTNQEMQDAILNDTHENPWATLILTNEISANQNSIPTNASAGPVDTLDASDEHTPPSSPPMTLCVPGFYPKQHPTQFLTQTLPTSLAFIHSHLASSPDSRVAVICKDGKDLSVGVATAALTLYFDDSGNFKEGLLASSSAAPTKDLIKRRLQWVLSSCPSANPARATLRRINEYLMSPNRSSLQSRGV